MSELMLPIKSNHHHQNAHYEYKQRDTHIQVLERQEPSCR